MAMVEAAAPAEPPKAVNDDNIDSHDIEDGSLKRKVSPNNEANDESPKRARRDGSSDVAATEPPTRGSRSPDGKTVGEGEKEKEKEEVARKPEPDRRKLAAQEEKKRGRRLFGGLMSTLNQTSVPNNSQQQKRRQEIERRQHERIHKQRIEDEQQRAEKNSRLHESRMATQIYFEEEVMKNRHSKLLSMAHFLRTRAKPHIYFLPWKRTPEQEDTIDNQIRSAKTTIASEVKQFSVRKERHIERYGLETPPHQNPVVEKPTVAPVPDAEISAPSPPPMVEKPQEKPQEKEKEKETQPIVGLHVDPHDESGDVLEEGEEDMVIY